MSSNKPAISVRNVGKSYQIAHAAARPTNLREAILNRLRRPFGRGGESEETFWALKDVSFDIMQGDVVGIIGRNGAGKSTLLKILSRITGPSTGEIDICGRVASLLEVGTGFHPELTGRENIFLNGSILGMSRREITSKFDEIVEFAGIEKFLDTPVKRYSSGMYVRLAFAVAAHLEPDILIVDEVLAVGDFAFQKKCLGKMQEVAGQGRTVLFVSHSMPTVIQLCQKAFLMQNGSLAMEGPADKVVQAYFTAGMDQSNETKDLSGQERGAHLYGGARIVNCRLESPERISAWTLPYGNDVRLSLEVAVDRPFESLDLGIALCGSTGYEVGSNYTSDKAPLRAFEPGRYSFEIAYPGLKLIPNVYRFDFGLRSERGVEDHVLEAVTIEILTNQASANSLIHLRRGAFIPDLASSIRELDDGQSHILQPANHADVAAE